MATVVTNNGKGVISARFLASAPALSLYVGWGTGSGTAAATDTALSTEAAEARAAAAVTQATTATANDTVQAVGTLTATATRSITNAGLFDASTSGNLIMKGDFTAVPLNSGDSIAFTMKIQFT
jgi:hypothetical protein